MNDQIVSKLRAVLAAGIDDECKAVYFLCECRKLLDAAPPDAFPFALEMYCNWALHVDLDRKGTTLAFLKRVDDFVAKILAGGSGDVEKHEMLRDFGALSTFREQLRVFLNSYSLATKICDDTPAWHQFLTNYGRVIEEGSLSCSAAASELQWVDRVVFSKAPEQDLKDEADAFSYSWKIFLRDGVTFIDVDVRRTRLSKDEPTVH